MKRLTVADVLPVEQHKKTDVVLYGALANQDPIDLAFIAKVQELKQPLGDYKQLRFTPFDLSTRRTEATMEAGGRSLYVAKGAVDNIIHLCRDYHDDLGALHESVETLSAKGYRGLAVAQGPTVEEAELVGFAALYARAC